ncbi:hypothetical protein HDU92_006906, partial [Lobulomyces angularis]
HPLSLICFDEDSNESWNGNLHGIPFFTYVESFSKKRDKVLKDQGVGIPFSKGFYLMSQLLSLLNPKSLGAMHEVNYGLLVKGTAPFTKYSLSEMLGVNFETEDFKNYYQQFCEAQKILAPLPFFEMLLSAKDNEFFMDMFKMRRGQVILVIFTFLTLVLTIIVSVIFKCQ